MVKKSMGAAQAAPTQNIHVSLWLLPSSRMALAFCALRNRLTGRRVDVADDRCAGWKCRSWNKGPITLPRRRTIRVCWRVTGHARTRKGIDVGVRSCESVRECLQEANDLVLLLIGQAEIAGRHVKILPDLGHRPAVHFFDRPCRAVSGSDRKRKLVACVVEVY